MFKNKTQTWVVMNDIQIPFHDDRALSNVLRFVADLRPYGVILNGDVVDCYAISDFSKDPLKRADLDLEIRGAGQLMEQLAKFTTKRIWIGGNHEDRLRRYMWKNAPALAVVPGQDFPTIFRLSDHGFSWLEYGDIYNLGKLLVTHGSIVSKHSAFTAKAHMEKYGSSVLVGHTHRLGTFYRRDIRGVHVAIENGCLCRLTPEYVQHPNWQQGFSVVHVDPKTRFFNVQQIPILPGGAFYYGGIKNG